MKTLKTTGICLVVLLAVWGLAMLGASLVGWIASLGPSPSDSLLVVESSDKQADKEILALARNGHFEKFSQISFMGEDEFKTLGTNEYEMDALEKIQAFQEIGRSLSLWREGRASKEAAAYIARYMDRERVSPTHVGLSLKERYKLFGQAKKLGDGYVAMRAFQLSNVSP